MSHLNNNPFNITKAVDYTDNLIAEAWVDIPYDGGGFEGIVKPKMPMPMLILGGKGSGKTHIMRYFSFGLQKIRYGESLKEKLKKDSYIGIYMRCGGLNAKRFSGKGMDNDEWLKVFSYYMELWLAQLTIDSLEAILNKIEIKDSFSESNVVSSILNLFDKEISLTTNTFSELKIILNSIQKNVDYEINQLSLTRTPLSEKVEILISPTKLIFGLPKIIEQQIPYFKDFQFLYLIDEYENLEEYHQKYFNSLIREREAPATFRVGVRLYGIKTFETFSGGESIKEGSEYELFDIDTFLRDSNKYSDYMVSICEKRLELSGYSISNQPFKNYFEEFSIETLNRDLAIIKERGVLNHFVKLRTKLKQIRISEKIIDGIIEDLKFDDSPLIERTNVFLFYRAWKSNNQVKYLQTESYEIKLQAQAYFEDNLLADTRHFVVLDKFKNDIIDQLCRENNQDLPYYGFDNFVSMSSGIPRVLLKTLKEVFKQSAFNGEKPFVREKISKKSQIKGLKISSDWFLEDASPTNSGLTKLSLKLLGDFLRELRFSDLPPECSIGTFSINNSYLNEKTSNVLRYLQNYSYIIMVPERREKNNNSMNKTYQINGILLPQWELAIHRRGIIDLKRKEIEVIFGSDSQSFKEILETRKKKYNHPLIAVSNNLSLFDDDSN